MTGVASGFHVTSGSWRKYDIAISPARSAISWAAVSSASNIATEATAAAASSGAEGAATDVG